MTGQEGSLLIIASPLIGLLLAKLYIIIRYKGVY